MQKIIFKVILVGFLALMLLIPLSMIQEVVSDRQNYRYEAMEQIAASWTDHQNMIGPVLVLPYKERVLLKNWDADKKKLIEQTKVYQRYTYVNPSKLDIQANIETEERYIGIYKFPVYHSKIAIDGNFEITKRYGISQNVDIVSFGKPYLVIGVNDKRGMTKIPILHWNETEQVFYPGANTDLVRNGIHSILPKVDTSMDHNMSFRFHVNLQGMSSFEIVPIGKSNKVSIVSSWPHPSFIGRFPPKNRKISQEGFQAQWEVSHFATRVSEYFTENNTKLFNELLGETVGVRLIEPVDIYLKAERSVKYGILFIGLTFTFFFLFEVLKKLKIHPVQYGLVGIALALFFLLLVSLSEHIAFALAYSIASIVSIALLSFYISGILKSWLVGMGFGMFLGMIYGVLYILLQSEDHALLMGSALLFTVLAVIMIVTRKINWYEAGDTLSFKIKNPFVSMTHNDVSS
ncbi:MAG: cell envelope integrity protein CreD [Verrucomicrobiota bacterium]